MRFKYKKNSWLNRVINFVLVMSFMLSACDSVPEKKIASNSIYKDLEFEMDVVQEATFPSLSVNIENYGAVGDGKFNNSYAIEKAIKEINSKGGGTVIIPRGIWLTGPIELLSNVNLHAQQGALIIFDADFDLYPLRNVSFEGLNTIRCVSPISGYDLENVAITGKGVFDGSGDEWRPIKRAKVTASHWAKLLAKGGAVSDDGKVWYPSEKSKKGDTTGNFNVPDFDTKEEFEEIKDFLRPVMISLVNCKKVLLDGSTFQNSPAWNLHPLMCQDVIIRNLTIRNPWYSQNGDGLDIESCKNVLVYNNGFDVGDDAICIKSGKNEDGLKRGIPTENVIIKNNVVYHGHGGFVVGSEMSGGVKNVHVSNCTFIGTDCGLRFKSTRGRGGVVEKIYISNIDMINIGAESIRFNLYYGGESPISGDGKIGKKMVERELVPVSRTTPSFRNIYMSDINSTGSGIAGFFQGLPEMKLQNIQLKNVKIQAEKGMALIDASGIKMEHVEINQSKGSALTIYNSNDVLLSNLNLNMKDLGVINVYGSETSDIQINQSEIKKESINIGDDVASAAIQLK